MEFDIQKAREVADTGGLMPTTKWLWKAIDRVKDLENALVEERAINLVESHDDICDPCDDCQCEYKFENCPAKDYFRKKAREQLQSGGVI